MVSAALIFYAQWFKDPMGKPISQQLDSGLVLTSLILFKQLLACFSNNTRKRDSPQF